MYPPKIISKTVGTAKISDAKDEFKDEVLV
jgi:hypothetical protein